MGREAVRTERRQTGASPDTPSPFILWEGGRDARWDAGPRLDGRTPADPLGLSMPSPSLFGEGAVEVPSGGSTDGASTTDAVGAPPAALPHSSREARSPTGAAVGRRPLDWRLIGASVLVCLAVAVAAIVGRGIVLGDAYARLSWEDHRVVAGETIDSILAQRDLPDVGLERLSSWTLERNGLTDALILPGQVLSVPR